MNTEHLLQQTGTSGQSSQTDPMSSKGSMRESAQQAGQQLKQKASETADQLKNKGSEALDEVKHQAREVAAERRDYLLERLRHCSAASRKAAEQLRQDNDPAMAGYAEALAGQLDRSSNYFRDRNLRMIIADTEDFARRRPELFFGGLFVAGLAFARFLKASSRQELEAERYGMHRGEYEQQSDMIDLYGETKAQQPGSSYSGAQTGSAPQNQGGSAGTGTPLTGTMGSSAASAQSNPGATPRPGSSAAGDCGCA